MKDILILAIETSCDDTSVAILKNGKIISNIIYNQIIHTNYGGVVPELASRDHEKNIITTVRKAIEKAQIDKKNLNAIAFTRGPGLIGSLLVGVCFAKAFALALNIPLIEVNHMQAHVMSSFIDIENPKLPNLCLLVSGGHTQIVNVNNDYQKTIIGQTLDDAAGECFDKVAKMLGLGYPGGPLIDKYGKNGDSDKFKFAKPQIKDFNYSFSGLKTNILYFLNKQKNTNTNFIDENLTDLCASTQKNIVEILTSTFEKAILKYKPSSISIAGGVSANGLLRKYSNDLALRHNIDLYLPKMEYSTDNAAMIAFCAYFKFKNNEFSTQLTEPLVKNYSL